MLRANFDQQLNGLEREIGMLAEVVERAVERAIKALKSRDLDASQRVVHEDDFIDQKRVEIEDRCVDLIATQQPMGIDLLVIISLLHIVNELERLGDYAEGIAKISYMIGDEPTLKPLIDIPRMTELATGMLRDSIDALETRDVDKANQVREDDDAVDQLYDQVYRELLLYMIEDPRTIQRATYLLWVAHDLERIADRATNIAERVIFLVTGRMVEGKAWTF